MLAQRLKLIGASVASLAVGIAAVSYVVPSLAAEPHSQPSAGRSSAALCAALTGQQLGGATIDKAEWLSSGTPVSMLGQKVTAEVCRVSAHISTSADSQVKVRIWLPANWNGKMLGYGGGGFNGSLSIDGIVLSSAVNRGYAAVSTDAGHDVSDGAKWAFGRLETLIDFGNRANHVGAIATKAVIANYYGRSAKRSYFHGCSNGGRDALMLAQRHPDDYDAIIAGAPANSWSALMSSFARAGQVTRLSSTGDALAPKLKLVHEAALRQCDARDGLKDGLISNPLTCRFDPVVLACKPGSGEACLSKPEVASFRAIYQGARTRDGTTIMPGFPPGSELEWANWFTAPNAEAPKMAQEYFRYMVYSEPTWDRSNFVLDRDYPAASKRSAAITDATDADLRPFLNRGGKLLMYHGWADPAIPAGNSVRYFEAARRAVGSHASQMRLIMVPGMGHCSGGDGPTYVDWLDTLEHWESTGTAPERVTATKFENAKLAFLGLGKKVLATRPVCAWPKTPHYRRAGSVDQETSFVCR